MSMEIFDSSALLPRLSPAVSKQIRTEMLVLGRAEMRFEPHRFREILKSGVEVPPSGGRLVDADALLAFRDSLVEAARGVGGDAQLFDLQVGRALWTHSQAIRGEFGVPEVWDLITLVLVPDLATRRFSPHSRELIKTRFTGGSRRHVLQRLWKRWAVFGPEIVQSAKLTEDDYGNLMERRLTSERPAVARAVAGALVNHPSSRKDAQRREYNRRFMRRLLMTSGIVVIDDSDQEAIDAVIEHIDSAVRRDLRW